MWSDWWCTFGGRFFLVFLCKIKVDFALSNWHEQASESQSTWIIIEKVSENWLNFTEQFVILIGEDQKIQYSVCQICQCD